MKTADLIGPALDWAVAKALGLAYRNDEKYSSMCFRTPVTKGVVIWGPYPLPYSTDWSQGGPIIEREGMSLIKQTETRWVSEYSLGCDRTDHGRSWGTTPLIAAMRCYVASKLGDEVDVPEELR